MSTQSTTKITGKVALIIGANSPAAIEVARNLYFRGGRIILADDCEPSRATQLITKITNRYPRGRLQRQFAGPLSIVSFTRINVDYMNDVRTFISNIKAEFSEINIIIHMISTVGPLASTQDGYQKIYQFNYLACFLIVIKLLPRLKGRVIMLSSSNHDQSEILFGSIHSMHGQYTPMRALSQASLCNIIFMKYLAQKLTELGNSDITTYTVKQKFLYCDTTDFFNHYLWNNYAHLIINPLKNRIINYERAVRTIVHVAVERSLSNETGFYYSNCLPTTCGSNAECRTRGENLWRSSLQLLGYANNLKVEDFLLNEL